MTKASAAKPELIPNAFAGQARKPTDAQLTAALGATRALWDALLSALAELGVNICEWHSYSPKAGWSLKLKRGQRTIVYFAPCADCFRVAFVLGDNAMQAARQAGLPARVLKLLNDARKYPEGTAVRLLITGAADLEPVLKLARVKRDH